MMLNSLQGNNKVQPEKSPVSLSAILRRRASSLLVFLSIVIMFVLFAVLFGRIDPYFTRNIANSLLPKAAFAAETADFIKFVSEGKHFSVQIPSGWEKDESFFLKAHKEYGVRLRAPGLKDLGYVLIDIAYYSEEYRTQERFIFDKLKPARSPQSEERSPVQDVTISGMKAKTFEIRSSRFPIAGIGDAKVEALEQYVVFTAEKGFYVLLCNTPAETAQNYRSLFEKVLHSFKPLITAQAVSGNEDGITDEEYKVYTDFFSTEEAPRIDSPVPLPFPSQGSLVYEKTSSGKKKDRGLPQYLEKSFGKLDASMIDNYNSRNMKDCQMKDKILVDKIKIFTEANREEIRKQGGLGKGFSREFMRRYPFAGEIIYLSRVGFNKEMNNALFYAGSSSGLMGAGYFILMEKTGNEWRLKNAVLDDFWYH